MRFLDRVRKTRGDEPLALPPLELEPGSVNLIDRVAPGGLRLELESFAYSTSEYGRVWYVWDWPRRFSYRYFLQLLQFPGNIRSAMFLRPLDPRLVQKSLEQRLTTLQAEQLTRGRKGERADFGQLAATQDVERLLWQIQVEGEPYFLLSFYVCLFAAGEEELEKASRRLEDLFADAGIRAYRAMAEQEKGIHSVLPYGVDCLSRRRNADLGALAAMFPFVSNERVMPGGTFYGLSRANGTVVILDDFEFENANSIVVGLQGSGKSMFLKYQMEQHALQGTRVYAIDIEGEFAALCADLGGTYLDMGSAGKYYLNVLDVDPRDPEGLLGSYFDFLGWLQVAIGRLSPREKNTVDNTYTQAMKECGIVHDDPESLTNRPPTLSDWYEVLCSTPEAEAQDLAARIRPYAAGQLSAIFNHRTNVRVENDLVVFGLKTVREELKPVRIRQIQSFIWTNVLSTQRRTVVVVDEAWHLMQRQETAEDLAAMARRFRKKYAGLKLATQHADDFARNPHAEVIRDTAASALLYAQQPSAAPLLQHLFHLNAAETQELVTLYPGEALLITRRFRMPIYTPIPPDRYPLYTTKPQELEAIQRARAVAREKLAV
jgi:conjugal transfer ATP-binding protein TraC